MHSPNAALAYAQPSRRAIHFSFPPTQRLGLLGTTSAFSARQNGTLRPGSATNPDASLQRQRLKLQRSYLRLLDALAVPAPAC